MRALVVVLLLIAAAVPVAVADDAPAPGAAPEKPAPAAAPAPAPAAPPAPALRIEPGRADANLVLGLDPDRLPIEHDELRGTRKPSGFWTGYRPARGGAYRWRMLAAGAAVLAVTIFLVARLLRRRPAAEAPSPS